MFISQFQSEGVEDSNFWVEFLIGNSNKLQKLVLEGKIIEPSMCSHCQTFKNSILKMWKLNMCSH